MADAPTLEGVLTDISSTIKDDAPTEVLKRVKDTFVERELARRTDALVKAFDKLSAAKGEAAKIRPDSVLFDAEGKQTSASYTKGKLEELNKANKQIEKIQGAISAALGGDFGKVYSL